MRGRLYPGIGISRSFGDYTAHRIGATSEPGVGVIQYNRQNEALVLATSSVWNVLTPKEVFEFIKVNNNMGLGLISKLLADKVKDKYKMENRGFPDITIII